MSLKYYLNQNIESLISTNPGITKGNIVAKSLSSKDEVSKSISYLRDRGSIYKDAKTNGYFHS